MDTRTQAAINRTIVELKFPSDQLMRPGTFSINRTIVELKFYEYVYAAVRIFYQSYHRGIEIFALSRSDFKYSSINRTIVELKW